MLQCPQCHFELEKVHTEAGCIFACPQCLGMLIALAVLRRTIRLEAVNAIRIAASNATDAGPRACPSCQEHMVQVPAAEVDHAPVLDVCPHCQMVWFDANEYEFLPKADPPPPDRKPLSAKSREAMAAFQMEHIREQEEDVLQGAYPNLVWWRVLAAVVRSFFRI